MSKALFACGGGTVVLPDVQLVLVDAGDGGNLVVEPPRPVWERSELDAGELTLWSYLVAAVARAMLDVLPQLDGGCINYWEAGNWALNDAALPVGPKTAPAHRRVHMHLLGRSRSAADPALRWGEAPRFPDFADRHRWAAGHRRLGAAECLAIVGRTAALLRERYGLSDGEIGGAGLCAECGYPSAGAPGEASPRSPEAYAAPCEECATGGDATPLGDRPTVR